MVKAKVQQDGGAMKKILLLVLAVTMVSSLAFGQTQVLSRNAVGYVKVEVLSNNLALCSLNFYAFDMTISSIFTNQLVGGANFAVSDQVIKWDPIGKTYLIFWKTTGGRWSQYPSTALTTNILEPGESFWIKNGRASNQTVYLMGEVPDRISAPTQEVTVVTNVSMVSYSFPVVMAITNLNTPQARGGANFAVADNIIKWDPVGKTYITYWRSSAVTNWRRYPLAGLTTDTLAPGEGFWYKRLATNFVWTEVKPYSWP
jgi:hypothetical protein